MDQETERLITRCRELDEECDRLAVRYLHVLGKLEQTEQEIEIADAKIDTLQRHLASTLGWVV